MARSYVLLASGSILLAAVADFVRHYVLILEAYTLAIIASS